MRFLDDNKVTIKTDCTVKRIDSEGKKITKVITNHGEFSATSYILSTRDGLKWLAVDFTINSKL